MKMRRARLRRRARALSRQGMSDMLIAKRLGLPHVGAVQALTRDRVST
jgi:hypothetical protein